MIESSYSKNKNNFFTAFLATLLGVVVLVFLGLATAQAEPKPKYAGLVDYCKTVAPTKLRNNICTDANLKVAVDGALQVCHGKTGVVQSDWGSACVFEESKKYVEDAARPAPRSVQAFNNQLKGITERAVAAAPRPPAEDDPAQLDCSVNDSCDLIKKYLIPAINFVSMIFGLVMTAAIIWNGILYSMAGADPQKVAKAKGNIAKAIFAILGYFVFYAFLQFLIPGGLFK